MRIASLAAAGLVSALFVLPGAARAQRADDVERARLMLSGIDTTPRASAWESFGPGGVDVLRAIYADRDTALAIRLRAVSAVSHFRTPRGRAFLEEVAATPHQQELFIRRALDALIDAFGDDGLSSVEPYLRHERPLVRAFAVRAIRRLGSNRGAAALAAHARIERDPLVLDALRR